MPSIIYSKWFNWFAIGSFFLCGLWSLLTQEPYLLVVPFIVITAFPLFQFIVTKTEQLYWLLLVVLPLSTEYNFTPSLGLDLPDEPLLIILSITVFASILYQPAQYKFIFASPIFRFIIALLTWMFISLYYAPNQWLALKYILAKSWYILPLVLLTALIHQRSSNFRKTSLYICIPMLLMVVQALIRHAFYGFDFVAIKKTMGPFFRNHVNYSAMLVCLLPIGLLIHQFTHPLRTKKLIEIGLGIAFIGLFFAYSRGAWLALIIGMMAYWFIKKNILGKTILIGMITIFIAFVALINNNRFMRLAPEHDQTIFHENFSEHLNATIGLKDISNAENSTVHNYFLLIAIEQGIPALLLFTGFFIYLLLLSQQLYHQFQNNYYRAISLGLGIMLLMIASLNFTSDLIETDKIGGLFWLAAGILISLKHHQQIEKEALAG